MVFRYRAIRKRPIDKTIWHLFKISDCPALLWSDTFFLSAKENTPVMCCDSIVRGHPDIDMFEGDYVKDEHTGEVLGIVVYHNGFYMQKVGSEFRKPIPQNHIYIDKGDRQSVSELANFDRTPLYFKYLNNIFDLGDFVSVEGDALNVIIRKKHYRLLLSCISELIYYDEITEEKVFDGDVYNGEFIHLDNISSITKNDKNKEM